MEITETFHAATRAEWRAWLEAHHADRDEIWLVGHRKSTGVASVPYHEAVEEALCFGWIDSIRKSVDATSYGQRFTPRREGSAISQTNQERLARLLEAGRVIPSVAEGLRDLRPEDYRVPAYIEEALKAEPGAWAHWQAFSAAYRRIRAAYVEDGRRTGAMEKRLAHLIRKTAAGKQFGYGIGNFY